MIQVKLVGDRDGYLGQIARKGATIRGMSDIHQDLQPPSHDHERVRLQGSRRSL